MALNQILVVDDDENIVNLINIKLSEEGYDVIIAKSGKEAIEKSRNVDINLIVMDVMLTDMNGAEAVKGIWEDPQKKEVPVIFLTGMLTKEEAKDLEFGVYIDSHVQATLAKPINLPELVDNVKKVLKV